MSGAANGLMYYVSFDNVSITDAAQDILEIVADAGVPLLIHSWKLTVVPTITSGVAQDVRAQIRWLTRSTTGTGGSAITPRAVNTRMTKAAVGTYTRTVTTPGTAGNVFDADRPSIIVPWERVFTQAQRIPVAGGTRFCINLEAGLGAAFNASFGMYVEEI
jgi:hypothetical protein